VATEAFDGYTRRLLVFRDDVAPVFGIELL
jgi:hypothetical protein